MEVASMTAEGQLELAKMEFARKVKQRFIEGLADGSISMGVSVFVSSSCSYPVASLIFDNEWQDIDCNPRHCGEAFPELSAELLRLAKAEDEARKNK